MNSKRTACLLVTVLASACAFGAEKCSIKEKDKKPPEHHRGWIGGEYKLARRHWNLLSPTDAVYAFPRSVTNAQKGVLITALSAKTPAYLAGLRESDLIVELDHEGISSLAGFRRRIDRTKPGASLLFEIFRHGELQEHSVVVGRETFLEHGNIAIAIPLDVPRPNLKFNPGFSLIALGLTWRADNRTELDSAEETFRLEAQPDHRPSDPYWDAWAGPIYVSRSREIRAQEIVAAE